MQTREGSLFQSQHFYRNNVVAQLSNKPAYPISLKQMVLFGQNINDDKLLKSANFVSAHLSARRAKRLMLGRGTGIPRSVKSFPSG